MGRSASSSETDSSGPARSSTIDSRRTARKGEGSPNRALRARTTSVAQPVLA